MKRTAKKDVERTTGVRIVRSHTPLRHVHPCPMNNATRIAITALAALLGSAAFCGAARADNGVSSTCTTTPPPADPALPGVAPAVVTYPAPSSTGVTKTAATLLASVDTKGTAGQVAFELSDPEGLLRCTAARPLAAVSGPQVVTAQLRSETPGTTVHFRAVVTTAGGQVVGDDQVFTTVAPIIRLAAGTTMLGVRVGYLTPAAAEQKVLARFARPLVFTFKGKRWKATPAQLGARADAFGAVERALAGVGRPVPVTVTVDPAKVAHYVTYLDGLYSRPARVGSVERIGRRAEVVVPQTAIAVQVRRMVSIITRTLQSSRRPPIEVQVTESPPQGPGQLFIAVRLGEQSLTLYKDGAVVVRTPVTTGRPALPTPVGSYDIAWRRSPYTFISPWPKGNAVLLRAGARPLGDVLLRQRLPARFIRAGGSLRQGLELRALREPRLRPRSRERDAGAVHDGAGPHAVDRRRRLNRRLLPGSGGGREG